MSWWPGDGDAVDIQSAKDGTLVNGATFGTGIVTSGNGEAFSFDGSNDYVEVAQDPDLAFSSAVSIAMWFKANSLQSNQVLASRTPKPSNGWQLDYNTVGMRFWIGTGSWADVSTATPSVGVWHHVVGTWDGATIRLYIDGVEVGSTPKSGVMDTVTASTLTIGAYNRGPASYRFHGLIDETQLFDRALTAQEVADIYDAGSAGVCKPNANNPPTADAGDDQSIRAGDLVQLDGSGSFDDSTDSANLDYSWAITSAPAGSAAALSGADTQTPSFVADIEGSYFVELIVADEEGLSSVPDVVFISSDNLPPTAVAESDFDIYFLGDTVQLDGSASSDPEDDALTFDWSITSAPAGSASALSDPSSPTPTLVVDVSGDYEITLDVSDFIGSGFPDTITIVATTAEDFAILNIIQASDIVRDLRRNQILHRGMKFPLRIALLFAVKAIEHDRPSLAIRKLEWVLSKTDGCVLRGSPDTGFPRRERDWITDCDVQEELYDLLTEAIDALSP